MTKTLQELQREIRELYEGNGWDTDPTLLLMAMAEEMGELFGRWLAEHPGYEKDISKTDPLEEEIGDLVSLIVAFYNKEGIDIQKGVENTIIKRKKQHEQNS